MNLERLRHMGGRAAFLAVAVLAVLAMPLWWSHLGHSPQAGPVRGSPVAPMPGAREIALRGIADDGVRPEWIQVPGSPVVALRWDAVEGLMWAPAGRWQPLGPRLEGDHALVWEHVPSRGRDSFVGQGHWRGGRIELVWDFAHGDPQARLSVRMEVERWEGLAEPVALLLEPGPGDVHWLDAQGQLREVKAGQSHRMEPADSAWIGWTAGAERLSLSGFEASSVQLDVTSEGPKVSLVLWRGAHEPLWHACAQAREVPRQLWEARAVMTLGPSPPVARSALPRGVEAAVFPVFDGFATPTELPAKPHTDDPGATGDRQPQASQDAEPQDAEPQDAEQWAAQVRALVYGHSSSSDPRFGNGGLVGMGLGGTIVIPATFASHPQAQQLRESLSAGPVDVMDSADADGAGDYRLWSELACDEVEKARRQTWFLRRDVAEEGVEPEHWEVADFRPQSPSRLATGTQIWEVPAVDARREWLTDVLLSPEMIARVERDRQVVWLSAPLLGGASPGEESLFVAEPDGGWTLQADWSRALAKAELLLEGSAVMVSGAARLMDYQQGIQKVRLWWTPYATLAVRRDGTLAMSGELDGLTLVAHGMQDAMVDDEAVARRIDRQGSLRMWWDLEAGMAYEVELVGPEANESPEGTQGQDSPQANAGLYPRAVQWIIEHGTHRRAP